MLNIANHQGNANHPTRSYYFTPEWPSSKRTQITNAGKGVEKRKYTAGENVNWRSHCRRQYRGFSNTKNGTTTWPSNSTPGHISGKKKKTTKTLIQKDTCTPMCIAALFKIARYGRNLSVYQQMNGGSSLGVQWLWFRAFTPMALGSIPDQGTKIL